MPHSEADMSAETTKLRIKLGGAEIEYEGDAEFLKTEVMAKVDKIFDLFGARPDLQVQTTIEANGAPIKVPSETLTQTHLSTSTIAVRLGAKGAVELALAAAANLVLGQSKHRVTRAEILAEMKSASAFYKSTMSNNLSNTLKTLVKEDRLREVATDTYALSHSEKVSLEHKLSQAH
jgi:hypothetical protein